MTESADYYGPTGLRTRGTVVVVAGRGETPDTYARFGRRLAADAYRVRVISRPDIDASDVAGGLARFADHLTDAIEGAAGEDGVVRPVVLVGADLGAAAVGALVAQETSTAEWWPEAVVLAGLPGHSASLEGDWEAELDARTFCPAHRGVLADDAEAPRGSLGTAVPDELLDAVYGSTAYIPQLTLVGEDDPLADRDSLARVAKSWSPSRLSVVRGAHHDVLNDLQHRSVAAEVVGFLETLRNELVPLVAVESSAW